MEKYKFKVIIDGEVSFPKGFYYQGKHIILVGCEILNHTIRRKEKIDDVEIIVIEPENGYLEFLDKRIDRSWKLLGTDEIAKDDAKHFSILGQNTAYREARKHFIKKTKS